MAMSCERVRVLRTGSCPASGYRVAIGWLSGGYRVAIGWENVRYSGSPEESDRIEFLTM